MQYFRAKNHLAERQKGLAGNPHSGQLLQQVDENSDRQYGVGDGWFRNRAFHWHHARLRSAWLLCSSGGVAARPIGRDGVGHKVTLRGTTR